MLKLLFASMKSSHSERRFQLIRKCVMKGRKSEPSQIIKLSFPGKYNDNDRNAVGKNKLNEF